MHISAAGFAENIQELAALLPAATKTLTVNLEIMEKREQVNVESGSGTSLPDRTRGENTQILGARELAALPDDPDAMRNRLQMLAAASGGGGGNAEVRVDGFLGAANLPSKSSIREVRVNPDLYSAQYDRAPIMGGLIEVATQPSLDLFHGGAYGSFDSWVLDAREPLSPARVPHQSRHYGANLTGPLFRKKVGFTLDFENRRIGQYNVVNAVTLNSLGQPRPLLRNVTAPQALWRGMARLDWQFSQRHSAFLSYSANQSSTGNSGVGGLVLAEAGSRLSSRRDDFRFSDTLTLGPSLLNEVRLGTSVVHDRIDPNSIAPNILVAGEFEGGGSVAQHQNQRALASELSDNLSYTHSRHTWYFGVQAQRRQIAEASEGNFNGRYIFGGAFTGGLDPLKQYAAWTSGIIDVNPTAFLLTGGVPRVSVNQWVFGAFAQDEWQVRPRLTLSYGLRYEAQTGPAAPANWAPRLGIAYALDAKRRWIVRARAGIFYRRIDSALLLDAALNGLGNQTQQITYYSDYALPAIATNRQLMAGMQPAVSFQPQISLEHQVKAGFDVRASFSTVRAWRLARSRNINAPLSANSLPNEASALFRPLGGNFNRNQYESSGSENGSILYLGTNYSASRSLTLFGGYMWMNLHTNADSPQVFPQSSYSSNGEWAAPSWQARHRVFAGGYLNLPAKATATFLFGYATGVPFNITTGLDNNADGVFNDRPVLVSDGFPGSFATSYGNLAAFGSGTSLVRNAGQSPGTLTMDASVSRTFAVSRSKTETSGRSLALSLRGTNLLNHLNAEAMNGVVGSSNFGLPVIADASRHLEATLRFSF